jgi:hypothetical protein
MAIIKVADLGISSGVNTPAFEAYLSADVTISNVTLTTIPFDTILFDTNNCYNNTTYEFTPNVPGKYYVYAQAMSDATGATDLQRTSVRIYKNTSLYRYVQWLQDTNRARQQNPLITGVIEMNGTTDYLRILAYFDDVSGDPKLESGSKSCTFGAYRIIGA